MKTMIDLYNLNLLSVHHYNQHELPTNTFATTLSNMDI